MRRNAFTLIELLIVITIMAILMTLAVATFNSLTSADRVGGGARQVQSGLAGARDRAIHSGTRINMVRFSDAQHGLRFYLDSNVPGAVTSLQFVERPQPYTDGKVTVERPDADSDGQADEDVIRYVRGTGTRWFHLKTLGVLGTGSRMRLTSTGRWHAIDDSPLTATNEFLRLQVPYHERSYLNEMPAVVGKQLSSYILELNPHPSPNTQPIKLPSGAAIDLAQSRAIPPNAGQHFDVLFSANGGCTGPLATIGVIHFYVGDVRDVTEGRNPATAKHGARVVTLRTPTGSAEIYPVDPTDANNDGIADNPFRFGER